MRPQEREMTMDHTKIICVLFSGTTIRPGAVVVAWPGRSQVNAKQPGLHNKTLSLKIEEWTRKMAQRVDLPPSLTTQVWSPKPTWGTERTNSREFLLTTTCVHWHMPPPPHTRKSRFLKCIAYNVIYTTVTQKRKEVDHCIGTRLPDLPGLCWFLAS